MKKDIIEKITSNTYRVLKILYLNQAKLANGEMIIYITQQNVADELSLSIISRNSIFKELMENNLVIQKGRGKYQLTSESNNIVKNIEKLGKGENK